MAEIVSRIYGNFRGVDFRGEEINLMRSPDSVNIWKDYKETESIRTRPGLVLDVPLDAPVYGIFFFGGIKLIHCGDKLYRVGADGAPEVIYTGLRKAVSCAFVYKNIWYFKDGIHYLRYDGADIGDVVGYVPTTTIGRKPSGGGTPYEDVNMLSPYRKNSFIGDGEAFVYYLDTIDIDEDFTPVITVSGETIPQYDPDGTMNWRFVASTGGILFAKQSLFPPAPDTDGQDNVVIMFKKTIPNHSDAILRCELLQVFDNRVFFSGNPEHPNVVWHSSLDDPTYCSDTDYYNEGLDDAAVHGMVAGNNALWVFREPSDANTTVFYHTPTIDDEYGKVYPSTHSSITTGCIGKAINFNDDIVFFSERGMEGISGDVTTEQVIEHRSTLVDRRMTAEVGYSDMLLEEWEGYLLVFIGERVYLADSRGTFQNNDHTEYEWFYWELGTRVSATCVEDGVLYLGTEDGVYTLSDNDAGMVSYWVTPKDKFKYPHKLKTSNKRGCVAEATGDLDVYAKVEDTGFELIGKYRDITDYFVSRIKRKKFKDIQLKFYSRTRFSLETVTLECFIGGYIKR